MASLTQTAATPEECECYASGVVSGVMTSASPLVVASLLVALRDAWMARECTEWIAALRWVLASPTRIWGSSVGVCVHGIGSHHPCQVCRDDVIRRKIAELEEQKP
jgi:hypothetical protein